MFSKFDTNIQSDELAAVEPTQADLQEYQEWLESQEAAEPELELMEFDPHLDFYRDMEESYDDEYAEYEYQERDLYGAEWENYAVREWD
tara:strand:+ start:1231 stop:1497 length:267 start_codon:yes stop_codon:yes gene_type:complete